MAIENIIVEYLLSGQFWAANVFALVATIYWSFSGTGMSSGNLRHQVTLTNWTNRIRFASMFLLPGDAESDDEIIDHIQETAITIGHPLGTCKMGDDDMAVVDDQLRVHGVEGLWVVDASIMPTIPRGNTNAPTIMIAEKAADFINEER